MSDTAGAEPPDAKVPRSSAHCSITSDMSHIEMTRENVSKRSRLERHAHLASDTITATAAIRVESLIRRKK